MTNLEWLRERLLARVDDRPVGDKTETLSELTNTEWSATFEALMRNRLLVGRFRYGRMDDDNKGDYDHIGSIKRRISVYEKTGNMELLVDVANLCLVEFIHCRHPHRHFAAQDDSEEHCKKIS
jgi:hypothetical protein